MLDIDSFSRAVALIYDAALDVERWDETLACLAELFKSRTAQIGFGSSTVDTHAFFRFWGFTDEQLRLLPKYREYLPQDPRMSPLRFKAVHCRQVVSDAALHASGMYREVLAPVGVEYALYFIIDLNEQSGCAVSLSRGPDDEPYTDQDCADFSRFVPHVQRAVTLHDTFHRLRQQVAAAREVIDGVPLGMLVVDDGGVVLANQAARAMLEGGDALTCRDGQLRAATPQGAALLTRALHEVKGGSVEQTGVTWPVGHDHQVRAVIRPLPPSAANLLGVETKAIALYLSDTRRPVETPEEMLQRLFGLTRREAGVLRALVEGDDLRRIATRLGIGLETVKTHVSSIMQRTGVRRQAQLIQLVLSSPAWMGARQPSNQ